MFCVVLIVYFCVLVACGLLCVVWYVHCGFSVLFRMLLLCFWAVIVLCLCFCDLYGFRWFVVITCFCDFVQFSGVVVSGLPVCGFPLLWDSLFELLVVLIVVLGGVCSGGFVLL